MPKSNDSPAFPKPRRWMLWLLGLPLYTVLLVPLGTVLLALAVSPPIPGVKPMDGSWIEIAADALGGWEWWTFGLTTCSIVTVTQCAFLLPVLRLRPPKGERSRPLVVSLVIGAAVAAVLTVALGLAVVELVAGVLHGDLSVEPWPNDEMMSEAWAGPGVLVTLAGSWVFWSMALLIFSRRLWADSLLGRLTVLLFGGTVVELLVVLPIDAMVRRRTDCYCATGTFFSMCFSAIALLWLTGPGIVFALTSRRRRLVRKTHCASCGQAKGPSPGPACPECGYAWLRPPRPGTGIYTGDATSHGNGDRSSVG